jgi:Zn finger protein HypA/HybF involved in hydrogenase expression
MTVIGKTFNCGNCKKAVTLSSEGTSFVCPHCGTTNSLSAPDTTAAGIAFVKIIIAIGLIASAIWAWMKAS